MSTKNFALVLVSLGFLVIVNSPLSAQNKQDYFWVTGYNGQNPHPEFSGTDWIFDSDSLRLLRTSRDANFYVTNFSIANKSNGNLLIYSDGCSIYDSTHNRVLGADTINYGEIWNLRCPEIGYAQPQGGLFFHFETDSSNIFHAIHQKATLNPRPNVSVGTSQLLFTSISSKRLGSSWNVKVVDSTILDTMIQTGHLTAMQHSNEHAWWVIQPGRFNDRYFTYLITENGIDTSFVQTLNHRVTSSRGGGGQATFSPNGQYYARYDLAEDGFFLFDFDRSTGSLENVRNIPIESDLDITGGCSFSPSSQYFYVTTMREIYQFDILSADIETSKTLVAEYDGYVDPFPTNFYMCSLGPDCRIYINSSNGVKSLHVIRYPDRKGIACNVAQHSIILPTYNFGSIPNFPHYRVDEEWPCDSTIGIKLSTSLSTPSESVAFEISPNPVDDEIHLNYDLRGIRELSFELYNINGYLVREGVISYREFEKTIGVSDLPTGLYTWRLFNDEGAYTSGKVIIK